MIVPAQGNFFGFVQPVVSLEQAVAGGGDKALTEGGNAADVGPFDLVAQVQAVHGVDLRQATSGRGNSNCATGAAWGSIPIKAKGSDSSDKAAKM